MFLKYNKQAYPMFNLRVKSSVILTKILIILVGFWKHFKIFYWPLSLHTKIMSFIPLFFAYASVVFFVYIRFHWEHILNSMSMMSCSTHFLCWFYCILRIPQETIPVFLFFHTTVSPKSLVQQSMLTIKKMDKTSWNIQIATDDIFNWLIFVFELHSRLSVCPHVCNMSFTASF